MQKGCGICGQRLNPLRENILNNDTHDAAFVATLAKPVSLLVESPKRAFKIVLLMALIAAGTLLAVVAPPSGESVTVRCDRSAVIAAGDKRDFRKERKIAFERCMHESFQTRKKPAS